MAEPRTEADVPLGNGRAMRVALELPAGDPPPGGWPGVVVLHEAFGPEPEIRAVALEFAARGYAAVVPDYFSAGLRVGCLVGAVLEVQLGKPGKVAAQLATVAGWLGERAEVDADRLCAIGFCLGGSFALLMGAVDGSGLKAVSANYGKAPDSGVVAKLPPVVGSWGGRDKVFGGQAAKLEQRLGSCGIAHDIKVYDDAGHSFLTQGDHKLYAAAFPPLRLGYAPAAAEGAWARIHAFLDEHTAATR